MTHSLILSLAHNFCLWSMVERSKDWCLNTDTPLGSNTVDNVQTEFSNLIICYECMHQICSLNEPFIERDASLRESCSNNQRMAVLLVNRNTISYSAKLCCLRVSTCNVFWAVVLNCVNLNPFLWDTDVKVQWTPHNEVKKRHNLTF